MGGIADYSGSMVLEMPIGESTAAFVQDSDDRTIRVVSVPLDEDSRLRVTSIDLDYLMANLERPYSFWKEYFQIGNCQWAAYIIGVLIVLMRECEVAATKGLRILIRSGVPEGKGVSSSAAVEVATMGALASAFRLSIDPDKIALLCQKVENSIAGAACGIMDQMTVVHGRANHLMALRCQPASIEAFIKVPDGLKIWGLDSGIRHAVSGSDYLSVRVGAFMGLKILKTLLVHPIRYLANLNPREYQPYADDIPMTMTGVDFTRRYGSHDDPVASIDPAQTYQVRLPMEHPIYENRRVEEFLGLLRGDRKADRIRMGQLMFESHESYGMCGLGSDGTDLLVSLARQASPERGLFGAKISGGGSGGTVVMLGTTSAEAVIAEIRQEYSEHTGYYPYLFSGSTDGMRAHSMK